ncbi:MAG: Gfo/Idh/MocA family oxidoreductase [Armatimonadetes bacterium]|nr:Gfo/Idh/MocA family oxidoreductase [Armatimonadota bacterium]
MAGKTNNLRVGMIRADKRALWYGAIFDEIDPDAYDALDPVGFHHFTYYSIKAELTHKRAKGFKLTKVYDADSQAAEKLAAAFGGRPQVCRTLGEVSEDVDLVFIANESSDGSDHLDLARPGLQKGVPTFIDRPVASTVEDAKALIRIAQRKRTPLLSCSHLRLLPHVERFKLRFGELEPLERGIVHGHGPNPADMADGIELALHLFVDEFGGRAEQVHSMGAWPLEVVLVTCTKSQPQRRLHVMVVNSHLSGVRHAFHASASSNFRLIYLDDLEAFVQSEGGLAVMNAIREMIRIGKNPLPYKEMLAPVAVAEAARIAHNTGKASMVDG